MFIDSNIFLEFLLKQENAEKAREFMNKVSNQSNGACFISNFNIDSIIIALDRNDVPIKLIESFIQELIDSSGINIYEITFNDRLSSLELVEKYDLDYEDALTLQATISTNSEELASYDKHFDKVNEIKRIEP